MKKIIGLLGIAFILATGIKAQTGLTPIQMSGTYPDFNTTDTVIKSTTYFYVAPINSQSKNFNQDVSYTVSMDSVRGTPDMAYTTWVSNDRTHWNVIASAATFNSAKNSWHITSTVPGISDSCITVNTNPWTGMYIGFKLVVNSNTQGAKIHIKVHCASSY